jgi:hypothetical protein
MTEPISVKGRGIRLNSPQDVRRICRRVINDIFVEGSQIEHAGRLNNLLVTWLRSWELEKLSDVEKRLTALEEQTAKERNHGN